VKTNVLGTATLLSAAKKAWPAETWAERRFLQVSTDEVYGSLPEDDPAAKFTEQTPVCPHSPYSASKASADLLVQAYQDTYGFPTLITRCSNNFGPYQFPEKLIPLMIHNALRGEPLPVYGDGRNVRDWIHVADHCEALRSVLHAGRPGEVYNIGADDERQNVELVKMLLDLLGKPHSLITFIPDRPGHDRRYAIDASKLRDELGWRPRHDFAEALRQTIQWYRDHAEWVEHVISGEYRTYYDRVYKDHWASRG
jgi:dTDP-glucose 4,6-dehydratase